MEWHTFSQKGGKRKLRVATSILKPSKEGLIVMKHQTCHPPALIVEILQHTLSRIPGLHSRFFIRHYKCRSNFIVLEQPVQGGIGQGFRLRVGQGFRLRAQGLG
jgi:hypothetical protein